MIRYCLFLLGVCCGLAVSASPQADFEVFCYHDVRDDVFGDMDEDQFAVSTAHLVRHFSWLQEHGYTPVSVNDILAARSGEKALPEKAVLLTFDDGYVSFYNRIFPVLKTFNFPAVYALVGKWLETSPDEMVQYGNKLLPRSRFLNSAQIQEMVGSGLIEFASHSYDLHKGVIANPQGNTMPAMVTRIYDKKTKNYEMDAQYQARIHSDLLKNSQTIKRLTGKSPRIMVWPYGAYNQVTMDIAKRLGMPISLTLDDSPPSLQHIDNIGRHLIEANSTELGLIGMLRRDPERLGKRVAHIDIDYLYDDNEAQQKRNFDALLDRIKMMQINTVYLQAFADPDGDGNADALYFPNRHMPVRADLFSRVAWQLRTRAGVQVYAWMPVLAFDLPDTRLQRQLRVQTMDRIDDTPGVYRRLSPFNKKARQIIHEIYSDLGRYSAFDGILFHDDLMLSDFEDTSDAALKIYHQEWGLPNDIGRIRSDKKLFEQWSSLKTQWLIDFTLELSNTVKRFRPRIKTARNIYASVIMQPESEAWFAQNYQAFVQHYDYTAVMAMPYMEKASDAMTWLQALRKRIDSIPNAVEKTVFELQSRDWRTAERIPSTELAAQIQMLLNSGLKHVGYYPDDFINGFPRMSIIRPVMSVSDYPYLSGTTSLKNDKRQTESRQNSFYD